MTSKKASLEAIKRLLSKKVRDEIAEHIKTAENITSQRVRQFPLVAYTTQKMQPYLLGIGFNSAEAEKEMRGICDVIYYRAMKELASEFPKIELDEAGEFKISDQKDQKSVECAKILNQMEQLLADLIIAKAENLITPNTQNQGKISRLMDLLKSTTARYNEEMGIIPTGYL